MLVLTRNIGEKIIINYHGKLIEVVLLDVDRGKIRLGIVAPRDVPILREELTGNDKS